jgi:hypothetical protein
MRRNGFLLTALCLIIALISTAITAQDEIDLPQTFNNGQSSFRYPAEWVVVDLGMVQTLATSQPASESDSFLESGEMRTTVFVQPITGLSFELPPDYTQADLIAQLKEIVTVPTCEDHGDPIATLVNKIPITTQHVICSAAENLILVGDIGNDNIVIIMATTLPDEMAEFIPILQQVATTAAVIDEPTADVVTTAEALSQVITSPEQSLTFYVPEDWIVEENIEDSFFGVTNGPTPLFSGPGIGDLIDDGQLVMILAPFFINDPNNALGILGSLTADGMMGVDYGSPTEYLFDDRQAASAMLNADILDGKMIVLELPGAGYIMAQIMVPIGELYIFDETIHAIIASVVYGEIAADTSSSPPPIDTAQFTESYTDQELRYSINFPKSLHVIQEEVQGRTITLLTPGSGVNLPPLPGEPFAILDKYAVSALTGQSAADTENPAVVALDFLNTNSNTGFTSVIGFEYSGRPAARSEVQYEQHEITAVILMLDDDNYIYANIITALGEMPDYYPLVLAALSTAQIANPSFDSPEIPLPQTFTSPDGQFSFDYPSGWRIESIDDDQADGGILIGSLETEDDTRMLIFFAQTPDETVEDLLQLGTSEEGLVSQGIFSFNLDGRPAAMHYLLNEILPALSMWEYAIDLDDDNSLRIALAIAPLENPNLEPTILAILASARQE